MLRRASSNEADGDVAGQPRFAIHAPADRGTATRFKRSIGVAAVPVVAVLIAVLAIQTTSPIRDAPPPLQTFVRPPSSAAQPIVRQGTKGPEPIVRVNVTPGGVDSLQLDVRGRCQLNSLETNEELLAAALLGKIVVSATGTGLKLGERQYATNRIEIRPEQSLAIWVNGHRYRGRMRLFRRTDGKVSAVNVLPMEEYLASVVDSEMPAKFPEAARQAQAIVARTYALYQIRHADPKAVYDLLSSQRSQKYLGSEFVDGSGRRLAGESPSSRRAVEETKGIVCLWKGKLFCAYYSAVCGGWTTDGSEVFKDAADVLTSVSCDWCHDSPHYRWTTELSREEFEQRTGDLGGGGKRTAAIRSIRQTSGPDDGLISRFEFDDGQRRQAISGIELRDRLPPATLFSPRFQIKLEPHRVEFEGRGHGHGVGFCQWGAKGQAEAGRNSTDIIRHYFPGVELTSPGDWDGHQ